MFKIQNFINKSRLLLNKINIPTQIHPPSQLLLLRSFTKFFIISPTSYLFGINLVPLKIHQFKTIDLLTPEADVTVARATKDEVSELIAQIVTKIREGNLEDASSCIDEAICLSEQNNFIEFLPQLYDFLILVNLREGNNLLAEEILVRSIEKLLELGYDETGNEIVRLQLILAKMYQSKGDAVMAGLGFRNCLRMQESNFNSKGVADQATTSLYLSVLFCYGVFLNEQDELFDSKSCLEKALNLTKSTSNDPERTIVILHNLAELSFKLTEFDDTIKYLVEGIRLCLANLSIDIILPVFTVKLGLVYLVKGMHETAEYWCTIAHTFAKSSNNVCVENEASLCLNYLKRKRSSGK